MHRLLEITHHQSVLEKTSGRLHNIAAAYLQAYMSKNRKLTWLEIVCDTVETSLSRRCPTNDDAHGAADASDVNPWVEFASYNFMAGKRQEIPEPTLFGVLSLLFPAVAKDCDCSSDTIMGKVGTWTTAKVRVESPVFDAIYKAYDEAVLKREQQQMCQKIAA
jgi:hypothetical protein